MRKKNKKVNNQQKKIKYLPFNEVLQNKPSYAEIKNIIKKIAGEFFLKRTGGQPMIIPVIMSKN